MSYKPTYKPAYDVAQMYMSEITSRLVAKTGIPTDRHHVGKMILQSLRDQPDSLAQIDGGTDQSETYASVLNRSVRCAIAMKKLGLKKDDVIVLMAPNTIDLCIPLYGALYLGVMFAGTDVTLGVNELNQYLLVVKPKLIFCQDDNLAVVEKALELAELETKIVVFNGNSNHITFDKLIKEVDQQEVEDFQCSEFDPAETVALLTSTSGTTGIPKAAMCTHKNIIVSFPYSWLMSPICPKPTKMPLILSPIQWLTASLAYCMGPIFKMSLLMLSKPFSPQLFCYIVNTYKPTSVAMTPFLLQCLLAFRDKVDFTTFQFVFIAGGNVDPDLIEELKVVTDTPHVYPVYGMSELSGAAFYHDYPSPRGSSGTARGFLDYRLVDQHTLEDITKARVPGELWVRGPTVFKGYYNNPELTEKILTEDGWLKTGDIFYRDDHWHFYYVERLKNLLKYRNHQVAPTEVEDVIRPVYDVCVVGIPDSESGDLVTACVIPKPGVTVTAQEIKDIVKGSLTDSKQLRGGVIIVKDLPMTSTTKINREKVQQMAITMPRE